MANGYKKLTVKLFFHCKKMIESKTSNSHVVASFFGGYFTILSLYTITPAQFITKVSGV